ncbi:MAG: peptidoglycan-binding protein [Lachnospiraceae bacterium]|nr:peptidoglycan-binding protein [Lachnospiraceae bacterium]
MRNTKLNKILMIILSCILLTNAPIYACATESETESVSLEEQVAILEAENEDLKEQIEQLESENAELLSQINGQEVEEEETEEESTGIEEEAVLMDEEEFKEDIVASYNGRGVVSNKYNTAEINSMTSQEIIDYYAECVEAERSFYEKYVNAEFEDLNIQYLCSQYIKGIEKQMEAVYEYSDDDDYTTFNEYWDSGYYNRAYVIVELSEYYDLEFGDVSQMKSDTESMDSLNEAETRNAAVDSATVQKVQQLLNDIGFYCGNADGISGKRTVKSIKRFQEMYGYEPVDGMIDDELIEQLELELANKNS